MHSHHRPVWARLSHVPLFPRLLPRVLVAMVVAWHFGPMLTATHVLAAGCAPIASPSADTGVSGSFDTAANVVATFSHARQVEGCSTSLSINQTAFDSAPAQQQMLMLFNAERTDRGLGDLTLDSTLLSQVDLNHSKEMAQYAYFAHQSPINQPGNIFARLTDNPAISGHFTYLGENIAAGYATAAAVVYAYMYQDSGSSWGHRHNILGFNSSANTFGNFNYVGIGVYSGGPYSTYYSSDFMQSSNYVTPATADTQAPSLSSPTIAVGNPGGVVTARVTNIQDTGACCGEAGITGVVFYVDQILSANGIFNTVAATQSSPGVWTASLTLPVGEVLHAVAVDGSGNYTDLAAGSSPPTIAASPTSVPSGSTTTTVTWTTGTGATGQIYVAVNGSPDSLFAQGASGSATATWITPDSTYVFTLYAGSSHTTQLASVTVTGSSSSTLLTSNGGFESGQAPWQIYSPAGHPIIGPSSSPPPHTGTQDATLCGTNTCVDALWQSVTVPAHVGHATLSLWLNATTQEAATACHDTISVVFFTTAGSVIGNPITGCNLTTHGAWVQVSLDVTSYLTAHQGQQIDMGFEAVTNATLPSTFSLDDISLSTTP